jgi:hypothetical protein
VRDSAGDGVVAGNMVAITSVGVVGTVAKLPPADKAATGDDSGSCDREGVLRTIVRGEIDVKSPPHRSHVTAPPHTFTWRLSLSAQLGARR